MGWIPAGAGVDETDDTFAAADPTPADAAARGPVPRTTASTIPAAPAATRIGRPLAGDCSDRDPVEDTGKRLFMGCLPL